MIRCSSAGVVAVVFEWGDLGGGGEGGVECGNGVGEGLCR